MRLQQPEHAPADDSLRLRRVGEMQRDDVARREHLVELDEPCLDRARPSRPVDDRHPDCPAQLDHPPPDGPGADDAQLPAAELDSLGLLPRAAAYLAVALRHAPRDGEDQGERVLRDRVRAVVRDVAHGDAALARLVEVDIRLDARPGEADDADARTRAQHSARQEPQQEEAVRAAQALDPSVGRVGRAVEPDELVRLALERRELLLVEHALVLRLAVGADEAHYDTGATATRARTAAAASSAVSAADSMCVHSPT